MTRHRDYTGRALDGDTPTNPGVHIARSLDDTDDESDVEPARRNTPVEVQALRLAERVIERLHDDTPNLTRVELAIIEYTSIEVAQRLAEIHSQQLANGPRVVARVRDLEAKLADHIKRTEDWRGWLCGVNDGNGQIGNLKRDQATIRADLGSTAERSRERSRSAALGWIGLKILAAIAACAGIVTYGASRVRSDYEAMIEARAADKAWRSATDRDIGRLFSLVNEPREGPHP